MNQIFKTSTHLSRQQLSSYLQGKLTKEEQFSVENHLLDCPLCSAAVEGFGAQANIDQAIKASEELNYKGRTIERKSTLRPLRAIASIAAVAVLSLGLGWLVFNLNESNPDELFASYYDVYANDVTVTLRGEEGEITNVALQTAMSAYDQQDYQKSALLLEEMIAANPEDVIATYYAGLSYLELGQLKKAADYLAKAANYLEMTRLNNSVYYTSATWYLALTNIKQGKINEAKQILKDLRNSNDSFYVKKAKALLKEL